jgi:glycosyltransferase involved in cell wall biosynthesis
VEIVVVDDGSVDDSARIASRYASVRLLRQGNRGVCAARNAGVAAARGQLLAFLDQDDCWLPRKLSLQVRMLLEDESKGFVVGYERLVLEQGVAKPMWWHVSGMGDERPGYFPGTLVVRLEVFERVGPFREDAAPGETADWLLRAGELGVEHAVVPEVVLIKRIHGANQSGDMSDARRQVLRAIKRSLDRRREHAR